MTSVRQSTFCSDSRAPPRGSPDTGRTLSSYDDIPSLLPCTADSITIHNTVQSNLRIGRITGAVADFYEEELTVTVTVIDK